jgi:DNA-binding CsgD family transcriptional regulator
MDVFEFNRALTRLTTPADCAVLFRGVIAPMGFDNFACGLVDTRDRDLSVFYIIDWTERWRRFYMTSGAIERDPVVAALATRREPFTWTDLRKDRTYPQIGRAALDVVAAEGWTEGFVVPLTQGAHRMGIVSLSGSAKAIDGPTRDYLTLTSTCLHNHVRTLVGREGFAAPPVGLTGREIECVRMVAQGFSDNAIAKALSIAPSTAHEFVEKAKRRLKTKSRAEMAAVAISLGIIEI